MIYGGDIRFNIELFLVIVTNVAWETVGEISSIHRYYLKMFLAEKMQHRTGYHGTTSVASERLLTFLIKR